MLSRGTTITAYGIDDVPVGLVRGRRSCCFEIELADGPAWLTPEAVHSLNVDRLTLVCMAAGVRGYSCLVHSAGAMPIK